jgi:hypothetical protein
MANRKSTLKEIPKQSTNDTPQKIVESASYLTFTTEHIQKQCTHLNELSTMLYEAENRGDADPQYMGLIVQGAQLLIETFANDIEDATKYFTKLNDRAQDILNAQEKGDEQ